MLRLGDLAGLEPVRRLPGRNLTKADIVVYRRDGQQVALKDYGPRPWWIRQTLGRWLVRRECAAYAAAGRVAGLPRFLGRVGPFALATRWIDATPLAAREQLDDPLTVFDRVGGILDELHRRGVALGDLHHRDLLVDDGGRTHVVDLATAWVCPAEGTGWRRFVFDRLRDADRVALARMRARFTGADVDEAVAAVGPVAARWHRRGRTLRRLPGLLRLVLLWAGVMLVAALARPSRTSIWLGLPLVAAGEAIRLWAAGHLLKTEELITSGPYRHVQHPLYLGRLLIFTGLALMAALPWYLIVAGYLLFFAYYLRRKQRVEGERLARHHGEAYRRYAAAVRPLLPRLTPYRDGRPGRWQLARLRRNRESWMVVGLALISLLLAWRAYTA